MDFAELIDSHIDRNADITIAAQPVADRTRRPRWASSSSIATGQIAGFEEKPDAERLAQIGRSIPAGSTFAGHSDEKPFVASMGIYVFSRDVLLDVLDAGRRHRLRPRDHPRRARHAPRERLPLPRLLGGRRDGRVVLRRQHDADARPPAVPLLRPEEADLHAAAVPARRRASSTARVSYSMVAEGCYINRCTVETSIVGIRTRIDERATVTRSVLLGADYYEADEDADGDRSVPLGVGMDSDRSTG